MTRTAFERLSLTPDNEAAYRDRQLDQVRERVQAVKTAKGDSRGIKRLERAMLAADEKLKEMRDVKTDPDLHFEYTGIDYLVVDELHHMKNLARQDRLPAQHQRQPGHHRRHRHPAGQQHHRDVRDAALPGSGRSHPCRHPRLRRLGGHIR
jgi:N12 class adenine-specific DNA methylase